MCERLEAVSCWREREKERPSLNKREESNREGERERGREREGKRDIERLSFVKEREINKWLGRLIWRGGIYRQVRCEWVSEWECVNGCDRECSVYGTYYFWRNKVGSDSSHHFHSSLSTHNFFEIVFLLLFLLFSTEKQIRIIRNEIKYVYKN